jgi:hypothetical protein
VESTFAKSVRDLPISKGEVLRSGTDLTLAALSYGVFEALKIDTQGNDFKVLLGAGNFLDNFAFVQFELPSTHCYDGTINFMPYADALLRSKGFNLIAKTLQKDGDAIYQNHRFANLKPDSVFTLHWW